MYFFKIFKNVLTLNIARVMANGLEWHLSETCVLVSKVMRSDIPYTVL